MKLLRYKIIYRWALLRASVHVTNGQLFRGEVRTIEHKWEEGTRAFSCYVKVHVPHNRFRLFCLCYKSLKIAPK